jgi:hypothetical protein
MRASRRRQCPFVWTRRALIGHSVRRLITSGLIALAGSCASQLTQIPASQTIEMQFSPAGNLARMPQPNVLLLRRGALDLSVMGIRVPRDCASAPSAAAPYTSMAVATCELYTHLESLDGFPTLWPGQAPASGKLKLETLATPRNLFVYNQTKGELVTSLDVAFDEASETLTFLPRRGWDVAATYVAAIRGFTGDAARGANGELVVGSHASLLFKRDEPLTCGASQEDVTALCPHYHAVSSPTADGGPEPSAAQMSGMLEGLESVRRLWHDLGIWTALEQKGDMPRNEAAVAWTFPTHTNPVVELMPALGLKPEVVGSGRLWLRTKGTLDPSTLVALAPDNPHGSVALLEIDLLGDGPGSVPAAAMPSVTVSYDRGGILLTPTQRLKSGTRYAIVLTRKIRNPAGKPLVPSPLVILLKAAGPLVDARGGSHVPGISGPDAQAAETNRQQLTPLLDRLAGTSFARPEIAYIYVFTFPHP